MSSNIEYTRYLLTKLGKIYIAIFCFYAFIIAIEVFFDVELFVKTIRDDRTLGNLLVGALIIAPLLEELIFRFWLNFTKKAVFVSFLFFIIGYWYWYGFQLNNVEIPIYLSLILLYGTTFIKRSTLATELIIICTSIIFGLIHMSKLPNYTSLPFYMILINTVRQMIVGYFLAKVRIEKGILYSISLHFLINLIAVSISILMK